MYLMAQYEDASTIDTLWFCTDDLKPLISNQSFEVFSIDGLKQILDVTQTKLFESKTCAIDLTSFKTIQNKSSPHQVSWNNDLLFIDTGFVPSFETVSFSFEVSTLAGQMSSLFFLIKMNGCRSAKFRVLNQKNIMVFGFKAINPNLKMEATSSREECPILA